MESKIKNLLKLKNNIVAFFQSDELPEKVLQFQKGKSKDVVDNTLVVGIPAKFIKNIEI